MKLEFCVLVADPRGSGNPRPVAETVGWPRRRCAECVSEKRLYSPTARWHVGVRYVDEWCAVPEEEP